MSSLFYDHPIGKEKEKTRKKNEGFRISSLLWIWNQYHDENWNGEFITFFFVNRGNLYLNNLLYLMFASIISKKQICLLMPKNKNQWLLPYG